MRPSILFPIVLASLTACSRSMGDVVIRNEVDPGAKATVRVYGEKFFEGSGAELVTRLPTRFDVRDASGVRTVGCVLPSCGRILDDNVTSTHVILETECGTSEWCVRFDEAQPGKGSREPFRATIKGRARPGLICTDEAYRIWVDNRGGSSRVVTVGAIRREIAAGETATIEMTAPPCASMAIVRLDGKEVGRLPVLADGLGYEDYDGNSRDFLLDPDAKHCYQSTTFSYAPNASMAVEPDTSRQIGAVFHELPKPLDAFLKGVPDSIQSYAGYGKRTDLVEIECPQK
jgi:hypothetical protein